MLVYITFYPSPALRSSVTSSCTQDPVSIRPPIQQILKCNVRGVVTQWPGPRSLAKEGSSHSYHRMVNPMKEEAERFGAPEKSIVRSWLCHFPAGGAWVKSDPSLCLSFPIYKVEIVIIRGHKVVVRTR